VGIQPFLVLWGAAAGFSLGPLIGWAIRSLPGHEALVEEYLNCWKCSGGIRRNCCNAGYAQDRFYILFSTIVGGLSIAAFGLGTKAILAWVFSVSCLIITIVDVRYLIIPDTLSINGCIAGLLYALVCHVWVVRFGFFKPQHYVTLTDSFLGFLIGGGFLWGLGYVALILLKKEGMGGGDVKLLAAIGAWMGWKAVLGTIVLASLFGSIGGISSILYNRIKFNQKYEPLTHLIPFGPYLCIGFMLIFFAGLEPLFWLMDVYHSFIQTHLIGEY